MHKEYIEITEYKPEKYSFLKRGFFWKYMIVIEKEHM